MLFGRELPEAIEDDVAMMRRSTGSRGAGFESEGVFELEPGAESELDDADGEVGELGRLSAPIVGESLFGVDGDVGDPAVGLIAFCQIVGMRMTG